MLDKTDMDWADEILGDVMPTVTHGSKSLDAEIETYLLDGQAQMDPVKFWQVSQYTSFVHNLTNLYCIGEPTSVSNNLFTCNGFAADPRVGCPM